VVTDRQQFSALSTLPTVSTRSTTRAVPKPAPLERQRERRRAHLVAVTAHVIATYGVDAVNHTLVAELAGCARTLVYKYFSRREDMLHAVLEAFDDGRERLDLRHHSQRVIAAGRGARTKEPSVGRARLEQLWQPDDWTPEALELRLAVLTLIRDVHLGAALGDHQAELETWIDERLHQPMRQLGLGPIQVKIVVDGILALQHHVTEAGLHGEITREDAIDLMFLASQRMLDLFREEPVDGGVRRASPA
jgi:AcrR family transcriptional regulator